MNKKRRSNPSKLEIAIIGEWKFSIYEEAFAKGLEKQGVKVHKISLKEIVDKDLSKFEYLVPLKTKKILKMNNHILKRIEKTNPDIALFWRPTHILKSTIISINKMSVNTISFNNDNPFNKNLFLPIQFKFKWLLYKSAIKACNFNFFYRPENIKIAIKKEISNPNLLLPYFRPWNEKKIELSDDDIKKYQTDVVFIGHYENDGRDTMILRLVEEGIRVKVWGDSSWRKANNPKFKKLFNSIDKAVDEEYTKALNGAKICLNFFSKVNNDVLTRRCFEIPACKRLLLSERSDFLSSIFIEDKEAVYFSDMDQLLLKIKWLLSNDEKRETITKNGYDKVFENHNVYIRAKEFLNKIC